VRLAVLAFVVLLATACSGRTANDEDEGEGNAAPTTELEISVTPGGEAPTKIWTLSCPDGGTLPNAAQACEQLLRLDDPFAPVPKDRACTQIYGGPQEADVRGTFRGRPVEAHFDRGNGCEIERWDKVAFLFPGT
jgi:Subtilisin inhibitor-like